MWPFLINASQNVDKKLNRLCFYLVKNIEFLQVEILELESKLIGKQL